MGFWAAAEGEQLKIHVILIAVILTGLLVVAISTWFRRWGSLCPPPS
jgi:xanthine/uracil permease